MVRVAHNANSAWFYHHSKWEVHRILEPSFGESSEDMTVSDLTWLSARLVIGAKVNGIYISVPVIHPQHHQIACTVPGARISFV